MKKINPLTLIAAFDSIWDFEWANKNIYSSGNIYRCWLVYQVGKSKNGEEHFGRQPHFIQVSSIHFKSRITQASDMCNYVHLCTEVHI